MVRTEILARPILHTIRGEEHTFYIIDNNTKYQYTTKNLNLSNEEGVRR